MEKVDTIAALATPPGAGGIAIVRLSGPDSLAIADTVFRGGRQRPSLLPGGRFMHGFLVVPGEAGDAGPQDLDEVILLVYRSPQSYTREDVIEIQGHGGRIVAARILRAVLAAGARAAEPGEFTRRAFLNGRLDLLQAEAVCDLIRARSDRAAAAALEQLEGGLSAACNRLYDALMALAADLEASLDFVEEELPPSLPAELGRRLDGILAALQGLLHTWEEGQWLREGALVVISGLPNAGKSTLMNRLLGWERAIVTPLPGTTRDSLEETLVLDGIPLRLVDTAGLREAACEIEQEGVRRARQRISAADIHIHVLDASVDTTEALALTPPDCDPRRTILVFNKIDLGLALASGAAGGQGGPNAAPAGGPLPPPAEGTLAPPDASPTPLLKVATRVYCSLLCDPDLTPLRQALREKLGLRPTPAHAVISERHRDLLLAAQSALHQAASHLANRNDDSDLLAAEELRQALEYIGQMMGRQYAEELLDSIFSRFCIGK